MTFEEANSLCDEMLQFLQSCGGIYASPDAGLEARLIECIAIGQYLIKRAENGDMAHLMTYWLINQEDVPKIAVKEMPTEKIRGNTVYVVDHGNKLGRSSLIELVRILRQKGPYSCWHHKGEQFKQHREVNNVIR